MDDSEFQHLVRIAFKEKAKAIAAAEARFRERIESLRQARELFEIEEVMRKSGLAALPYGEVSSRVKRILSTLPETFSLADVTKAVREQDAFGAGADNKAISVVLRRMVGDQLELIERGQGKRGSTYRKTNGSAVMTLVGQQTRPERSSAPAECL